MWVIDYIDHLYNQEVEVYTREGGTFGFDVLLSELGDITICRRKGFDIKLSGTRTGAEVYDHLMILKEVSDVIRQRDYDIMDDYIPCTERE